jgi:hypothetical protein
MSRLLPDAVSQWEERAAASPRLQALYWDFDTPSSTWTLTTNPALFDGEFVDVGSTGTYVLSAAGTSPSSPRLRQSLRGGVTAVIY